MKIFVLLIIFFLWNIDMNHLLHIQSCVDNRLLDASETGSTLSDQNKTSLPRKLEQYMDNAVQLKHFSGVAMIAYNGQILLNQGYGIATNQVLNTSDTVVHVASITKQFTAAAILLLWEQGKIDLHISINHYLPKKFFSNEWSNVTVHHLLSHTSGIIDYAVERDYYDVRKGFCFGNTVNGMINEARYKPLQFEPGSHFNYSNIGFTLLGAIIEEQAGCSYRNFIKEYLLKPTGMTSSDIHKEGYEPKEGHASGHRWDEDQEKHVDDDVISLPVTAPDGGLFTTTEDLLKWSCVLTGKTIGIISVESLKKMTTPNRNIFYLEESYGYGLFIDDANDIRRIHHPGYIVGFTSHFCLYPEKEIFIAIFCNTTTADPRNITKDLSDIILER